MNLRKLFNFPSKFQEALIAADVASILAKCDDIATSEYKDQRAARNSHDEVCPNCHGGKENIVNKIAQVQGSGSVGGTFHLGYGSISGSVSIDSTEVNHCNKCGNQWKKFKMVYVDKTDILKVSLNYLSTILKNPEEKNYRWKMEAIKVFDGCNIETILMFDKDSKYKSYIREKLNYETLKPYFKSLYDTTPRKLRQI
jgi:hypothetical protein